MIKSHPGRVPLLTDIRPGQFLRTCVRVGGLPPRTVVTVDQVGSRKRPYILITSDGMTLRVSSRELYVTRFRRINVATAYGGYVTSGDYVMRTPDRLRFLDVAIPHDEPLLVAAVGPTGTVSLDTCPVPLHVAGDEFRPDTFVALGRTALLPDAICAALRCHHHIRQPGDKLNLRPGLIIRRTGRAMAAFQDAHTPHNAYLEVIDLTDRMVYVRDLAAQDCGSFPREYATVAFYAICDEPV